MKTNKTTDKNLDFHDSLICGKGCNTPFLLKELCGAFGVSGMEDDVRSIIIDNIQPFATNITIDDIGNVIAYKKGRNSSKSIMLCTHMDEVGFIISGITPEGFLRFKTIGGIDTAILPSSRISIKSSSGFANGVIGHKAIHLLPKDKRDKNVEISDLYIDIGSGVSNIELGDCATFASNYVEFGDKHIKAKALDNRAGCSITADLLKNEYDCDLYCCFSVMEEIGLVGAKKLAMGLKDVIDYALIIEATVCNDLPSDSPNADRVTVSGAGPAVSLLDRASFADREIVDNLINTADKYNIPYQFKASNKGGNDAGSLTAYGIKTASVSVPCRYIHSPVSVMNMDDYNNTRLLIHEYLNELKG